MIEHDEFTTDETADTTHEAVEDTGAETSTALALNLPRGAEWLREESRLLAAEAEKYRNAPYGTARYTVRAALMQASSALRGAIGFALDLDAVTED